MRCPQPGMAGAAEEVVAVVVRQNEDGFEIVDGEHGWRAAKEVGLATIACEVIEADDFEAMRRMHEPSRYGKPDTVGLIEIKRRMMVMRRLSTRTLARKLGVCESTILPILGSLEHFIKRCGNEPKFVMEVHSAIEELVTFGNQFEEALQRFRKCPEENQEPHDFHGFVALRNALYDEAETTEDHVDEVAS
jgi:hypothetical protein